MEVNSECEEDCLLRCTDCDICVHSCECTCQDYLVLANICKHIHLTVRTKKHKTLTKGRGVIDTNKNYSEMNNLIDNMEADRLDTTTTSSERENTNTNNLD